MNSVDAAGFVQRTNTVRCDLLGIGQLEKGPVVGPVRAAKHEERNFLAKLPESMVKNTIDYSHHPKKVEHACIYSASR